MSFFFLGGANAPQSVVSSFDEAYKLASECVMDSTPIPPLVIPIMETEDATLIPALRESCPESSIRARVRGEWDTDLLLVIAGDIGPEPTEEDMAQFPEEMHPYIRVTLALDEEASAEEFIEALEAVANGDAA